ncbi:hypothetical protein ACEPPN_008233 [Leptodophora sp. 'Broadleaf-Isolate-01']
MSNEPLPMRPDPRQDIVDRALEAFEKVLEALENGYSFANYDISEDEDEEDDEDEDSVKDGSSGRPAKVARTKAWAFSTQGATLRRAGLRSAKNYADAADDNATTSGAHSFVVSRNDYAYRPAHSRNGSTSSFLNDELTPASHPDIPSFSSPPTGSAPAEAVFAHPPTFKGKCDFCLRQDALSLILLASAAGSTPAARHHFTHANSHFTDNYMAHIRLSAVIWNNACCSRCIPYVVGYSLPIPLSRTPKPYNGAFPLRAGAADRSAWVDSLRRVWTDYVVREQAEELFLSVFDWEVNVNWINKAKEGSAFKNALLWFREELELGIQMQKSTFWISTGHRARVSSRP